MPKNLMRRRSCEIASLTPSSKPSDTNGNAGGNRASAKKRKTVLWTAAFYIGLAKAGFGGAVGLVATPLLALVMPAKESVALMLPLLLLTDIANSGMYWGMWNLAAGLWLLPGAVVGTFLATGALVRLSDYWVKKTLGILALAFAPAQLAQIAFFPEWAPGTLHWGWESAALGLVVGFAVGVFSTIGHVGGVISTMYFLAVLPKENVNTALVGTTTILYFFLNALKMGTYTRAGLLTRATMSRIPRLLPMLALGLLAGKALNASLGGERVDWFIAAALTAVAAMGWKLIRTPKPSAATPPPDPAR